MAEAEMHNELEAFNKEHAKAFRAMASSLQRAGVLRVHYGLDFNNDEADLAEYAVVEYADGRIEEQNEWYALLDHEILGWNFPFGSGAYTFDATTARVLEDAQGGMVRLVSRMSRLRAYHTPERREKLETANARRERQRKASAEARRRKKLEAGTEENRG
jgi:hypothetical protein